MTYEEFLATKIELDTDSGFDLSESEINNALMSHQKDAVLWACRGGRRAIFAHFGMGKSCMQIEFCYQVLRKFGGKALIVMPLGVKQEFTHDAVEILGYEKPTYVKTMQDAIDAKDGSILLSNYERVRDGDIDPSYFTVTSLDEASVLRSYGSKTFQEFLEKFKGVPYKLVATATPAPNRFKELTHYAGYLEIADTGNLLTRFFKRDSTKSNNLTLYPTQEENFWFWMSSWALFLTKPSDISPAYSDKGYSLPEMEIRWHELPIEYGKAQDRDGQISLFTETAGSLSSAARVKRDSLGERLAKVESLLKEHGVIGGNEQAVVWVDLNDEQKAVEAVLKKHNVTYSSLYGDQNIDFREEQIYRWKDKKTKVFLTKPEMYGQGVNLQQCHFMIFAGIDYKFEKFIQAIHREYRFGQTETVIVDIIHMENERSIKDVLIEKWKNHNDMVTKMTSIVRQYGLGGVGKIDKLKRKMGVKTEMVQSKLYTAINGDSVVETKNIESNSVDLIHTSIPFGNHYEYSSNYADMGFNDDDTRFFEQMDYLTPELLRILKPGRVAAIHVKDRVEFGSVTGTGFPTIEPFHADCIAHYIKHGFKYFGMITIVTDVVRENNQTYRLGWTEQCKDATKMGVGCPEYLLLFRKQQTNKEKGYADEPVTHDKQEYTLARWQLDAHAFWRSSGDRIPTREEILSVTDHKKLEHLYKKYSRNTVYNFDEHLKLAEKLDAQGKLPTIYMVVPPASWTDEVWDDVVRMRTLNTAQSLKGKENHICPLPIDIVERTIERFSNKGELVFDPFGGIGTVPYVAIQKGRRGMMIELSTDYYRDALGYLEMAESEASSPTLFDFLDIKGA